LSLIKVTGATKKMTEKKVRTYVKIGVAGPVGSGKTALIERLTRKLLDDYSIGVITNDIYTKEDAEFLTCLPDFFCTFKCSAFLI